MPISTNLIESYELDYDPDNPGTNVDRLVNLTQPGTLEIQLPRNIESTALATFNAYPIKGSGFDFKIDSQPRPTVVISNLMAIIDSRINTLGGLYGVEVIYRLHSWHETVWSLRKIKHQSKWRVVQYSWSRSKGTLRLASSQISFSQSPSKVLAEIL